MIKECNQFVFIEIYAFGMRKVLVSGKKEIKCNNIIK